ncbi:MAG TPA: 50S ribosomal protein L24 [Candidatus Paceibacterota bacterium]|nr:50S ribosomal protein L24 [Candidatus Paceibacterota bacterium]
MKLKKGDTIKVLSGKDRGRTGTVLRAMPGEGRIVVDGLNIFKKRSHPKRQGEQGQTVLVPRPMAASKVMLICPACKEPTRVGARIEGAKKVRYCKKCQSGI